MNHKTDFFLGIGVFLFSVLIYLSASKLPGDPVGIGAKGFPQFIAVCMGGLGILLSVVSYIQMKAGKGKATTLDKKELIFVGLLVVCFAGYLFAMRPLGYLIATPIFMFLFMLIYGERKWLRMALISVGFTVAVFLLFEKAFYISLPHGII